LPAFCLNTSPQGDKILEALTATRHGHQRLRLGTADARADPRHRACYLQLRLKFMPITAHLAPALQDGLERPPSPCPAPPGDISPYAALMTALAATVGTGNIAGVATAIAIGGPGALFWMWMTALVGMATKYAEVLLAVHYRETDDHGEQVGGPMYAIKNGLEAPLALARRGLRDLRRHRRLRHRQHGAVEQRSPTCP
jgi:Na+/alanine symporter